MPEPARALILGASGGIGAAFVRALHARGTAVTALSRSADGFDVTDEASVARHSAALAGGPGFDLIVNACGALVIDGRGPEKALAQIDPAALAAQFALNAIGPALVCKHLAPLLAHRETGGRAILASLSARVGSIADNRLGGWYGYRASKAAQNQILRTAAIEIARRHKGAIIVALHPGTVATALSDPFARARDRLSPDDSAGALLAVIEGLSVARTGGFFDWRGRPIAY